MPSGKSKKPLCRHKPRCPLFVGDRLAVDGREYELPRRRLCRMTSANVRAALDRFHRQAPKVAFKLKPAQERRWRKVYFALIAESNGRKLWHGKLA